MKKKLFSQKGLKHLFYSVCLLLLGVNASWGQSTVTYTANVAGVTKWTCPAGVTSVQVETWSGGGGGAGASSSTNLYAGGGGAGGNYAKNKAVTVVPGQVYNVTVGAGGTGGSTSSSAGYGGCGGATSLAVDGGATLFSVTGGTGGHGGGASYKNGFGGANGGSLWYTTVGTAGAYTLAPTAVVIGTAWTASATVSLNDQVFNAGNLYTVTTAGTLGTDAPIHTSGLVANGSATLAYAGVAATASCSLSTTSPFGISYVNMTNAGSGYLTAPTITFVGGTYTAAALATATINPFTVVNTTGTFTSYLGGNGGVGSEYIALSTTNTSGGGGGSAGTASNGNRGGAGVYGGALAVTGGGAGAAGLGGGGAIGTTGITATELAGGGSGATAMSKTGGAGAAGKIVITILDAVAPNAVASATISNPLNTTLQVNWVASTSPDVTGYVVVAYANTNPAVASLVAGTTYAQGDTFGDGTVLYIGTGISTLSAGLILGNTYYYKVYAYDAALNYSAEVETSGTTIDAVDDTPPGNPGVASISNQTLTTLTTSWLPAASTDGGGYMVVRYSGDPSVETGGNPVQKTTYLIGNVIATGTPPEGVLVPLNGKVVYVGTGLSCVTTGLNPSDNTYFKVYTFDQDHNYSQASTVTGKTATQIVTPVALAATSPTANGFTANWETLNAGGYSINIYKDSGAAPSTIVGWNVTDGTQTAADFVSPDMGNSNNRSNKLTQNGGASFNTTVSGSTGTGFAARGATYYSTYLVSGTEEVSDDDIPANVAVYANAKTAPDRYFQIEANTLGYKNVTLSSAQYSAYTAYKAAVIEDLTAVPPIAGSPEVLASVGSGPRDWKLQYSSTGTTGTFKDLGTSVQLASALWDTSVNNLTLPAECDNNPNVVIRWVQSSFYNTLGNEMTTPSTGGTSRIDNILVKGTQLTLVKTQNNGANAAISEVVTNLDTGSYYYDIVANKDNSTSLLTNVVSTYVTSAHSALIAAATLAQLDAPVATDMSNSTEFGFTANWGAVAGATDYALYLYVSNASSNIVGWSFSPISVLSSTTSGLTGVTLGTANAGIVVGQSVSGTGIASGTTVSSVNGTNVVLSLAATATTASTSLIFTPTSLAADVKSTNNTTNTIVQSKSTAGLTQVQFPTGTYTTCVTATTSTWLPITDPITSVVSASGSNWEIQVNTLGYKNTTVSSKQYASQAITAARDFKVQYKIGVDGTYADVPLATITVAKDWTTGVLNNVALPAECDNQPLVYLRWINYTTTNTGGTGVVTAGGISLDDVYVKGTTLSLVTNYPVTVATTSNVITGLTPGSTYYYKVKANGDSITYATSVMSNTITGFVYNNDPTNADYRTSGSGSLTTTSIWEYFNGGFWVPTTRLPLGTTNNITVSAGHTITLATNFSIATGKTFTVNGTLNLAGFAVTGGGTFALATVAPISPSSAADYATLQLGNNVSIATGIATTNKNLASATNYVYNGVGVFQNFTALPATISGNITISNTTGVSLVNHTAINNPGQVSVAAGSKLWFGDGNVGVAGTTAGTYNLTGSGKFTIGNGATLVVTGSKGLSYNSGNMAMIGTRTWGSDINFYFYKNDGFTVMQMGDLFAANGNPLNLQSPSAPEITSINHLVVNNPFGVYLGCAMLPANTNNVTNTMVTDFAPVTDITIKGNLIFTSGKLIANNGTLELAEDGTNKTYVAFDTTNRVTSVPLTTGTASVIVGGSITGAGTGTALLNGYTNGKWVVGNLKKLTASGVSPSLTYPIGDATTYMPLALTFSGTTSAAGGLTARTNPGDHAAIASSDLKSTKSVNRTWTLTNDALAGFGTYGATFNYASTDNDAGVTSANYGARLYNGAAWSAIATSGTSGAAATATGISGFGDFAIGEFVSAPAAESASYCVLANATVASLVATGTNLKWYADATGGTALTSNVALASRTYYVSQTIDNVESLRTAVSVTIQAAPNAGTNGTLTLCAGTTPSNSVLFAQLGGSPAAGGTWANSGLVYTYTVGATSPCTTAATATVTVTFQPAPKAGTNGILSLSASPSDAALFVALTGADAGGSWSRPASGYVGVYTYTVAATSPCTVAATATVTVTASTQIPATFPSFCKGATIATATGSTTLKFYKALTGAAVPATTALATGTYYVTEMKGTAESTRVPKSIVVDAASTVGKITGFAPICKGTSKTLLLGTSVGSIQWQSSTTSATATDFTNIPGATTATYTASPTVTTWYRVVSKSGICSSTTSAAVVVTVSQPTSVGELSTDVAEICNGSGTTLILASATGTIAWQKATVTGTTVGTFAAVKGNVTTTLATGALKTSTAYKVVVSSGLCQVSTSDVVTVTVSPKAVAKTITGNTTCKILAKAICTTTTNLLTLGTGSVGSIQWQSAAGTTAPDTNSFSDIANATSATYDAASSAAGNVWFRVKLTSGVCSVVYSKPVNVWFKSSCSTPIARISPDAFKVVAYPNPSTEGFTIKSNNGKSFGVQVYDMLGRSIEQRQLKSDSQIGSNYAKGVYNVIVTQDAQVKTLRVIKK